MPSKENQPSLRVFREVREMDMAWIGVARRIMRALDIGNSEVELRYVPRATLIAPSEVRNFHLDHGIKLTNNDVVAMADFLDTELPDSTHQGLDVATGPWGFHQAVIRDRLQTSLMIATKNQPVKDERSDTQNLIGVFSHIPEGEIPPVWPEADHVTSVHIANFKGERQLQNLERFAKPLLLSGVIAETVKLEPATIEEI